MTGWRDHIDIHPAAELFPLMSPDELGELVADIEQHGLQSRPIIVAGDDGRIKLLDGRNRLDALERLGYEINAISDSLHWRKGETKDCATAQTIEGDPYNLVMSLNFVRRHLNAQQKREAIEKLLKVRPETSDRGIAGMVKVDSKTVGAVRKKLEGRAEIPHVSARVDTKGRQQPVKPATYATPNIAAPADDYQTRYNKLAEQRKSEQGEYERARIISEQLRKECDELKARVKELEEKLAERIDPSTDSLEEIAKRIVEYIDPDEFMKVFRAAAKPAVTPRPNGTETATDDIDALIASGVGVTPRTKFPFGALRVGRSFIAPYDRIPGDDDSKKQNYVSSLIAAFRRTHPDMKFTTHLTDKGVLVTRVTCPAPSP